MHKKLVVLIGTVWLHRNIQHVVKYTASNPARFEKLWAVKEPIAVCAGAAFGYGRCANIGMETLL